MLLLIWLRSFHALSDCLSCACCGSDRFMFYLIAFALKGKCSAAWTNNPKQARRPHSPCPLPLALYCACAFRCRCCSRHRPTPSLTGGVSIGGGLGGAPALGRGLVHPTVCLPLGLACSSSGFEAQRITGWACTRRGAARTSGWDGSSGPPHRCRRGAWPCPPPHQTRQWPAPGRRGRCRR